MAATACGAPFATASPAELREAILPDDVPQFDRSYREALDAAAETLRLDELEKFLAHRVRIYPEALDGSLPFLRVPCPGTPRHWG